MSIYLHEVPNTHFCTIHAIRKYPRQVHGPSILAQVCMHITVPPETFFLFFLT